MYRTDDLWTLTQERARSALACGALQPVATATETVRDGDIDFIVYILERLERKERAGLLQRSTGRNPFLPYDPRLLVNEISATHICLLNKFNVLDQHLLIVTRRFEQQEELLGPADFDALWRCQAHAGGLGFYNAGEEAGASQAHKHLQLVPLPLGTGPQPTPIEQVVGADNDEGICSALPYRHSIRRLDLGGLGVEEAAAVLVERYRELLAQTGIRDETQPYNLLLTSRWMMVVPRSTERCQGISVNALGFAGSLLVRDREELQLLRDIGPLQVLKTVALPPRT